MPRGAEECYGLSVPMGIVLEEEAGLLSALESTLQRGPVRGEPLPAGSVQTRAQVSSFSVWVGFYLLQQKVLLR
jgi:hypothetical protein